jgi:hypothetical protein
MFLADFPVLFVFGNSCFPTYNAAVVGELLSILFRFAPGSRCNLRFRYGLCQASDIVLQIPVLAL